MSIAKRITYLKGLAEGLGLGRDTKEEKILQVMIEILDDISLELTELKEEIISLDEDVCELAEGVDELEDTLYEEPESCVCPSAAAPAAPPVASGHAHEKANVQLAKPPLFYSVVCPSCQNEITVDEDVLDLGAIDCPNCGEKLEFDLDEEE